MPIVEKDLKNKQTPRQKAVKALKDAIHGVIQEHKKSGRPLVVWKNGKAVRIPAKDL
jgi:hypothetical protein